MKQKEHGLRCIVFNTIGPLECCLNPVSSHHSPPEQHQEPSTESGTLRVSGPGYVTDHMLPYMASPILTHLLALLTPDGVDGADGHVCPSSSQLHLLKLPRRKLLYP